MWTRVLWSLLAGALLLKTVAGSYGYPSRGVVSNPFIRKHCGGGVSCPTSAVSSEGCPGGSGCGGSGSLSPSPPKTSPAKKYWWMGEDSPFKLPAGHQITHQESNCGSSGCTATIQTCGGVGCPSTNSNPFLAPLTPSRPQVVVPPAPALAPAPAPAPVPVLASAPAPAPAPSPSLSPGRTPALSSANVGDNQVNPPMGICPSAFVCVHWQLCRNGYVITDGSGRIDKLLKDIPTQLVTQFRGCGTEMFCCQVPSYNPPSLSQTPSIPLELPRPSSPSRSPPAPQPTAPVVSAPRPASRPRTTRPQSSVTSRPVVTPQRGTLTPSRPRSTPLRPAKFPSSQTPGSPARPPAGAPSPARPVLARPSGPRPQPTVINQANPLAPAGPVAALAPPRTTQPRQQPTVARRPVTQPPRAPSRSPSGPGPSQGILSNPLGLVSPPSPQPMGMPGMGMPGMPMGTMAAAPPNAGGACSAGTYCVARNRCNPYTGFIINDPNQLMAVWPNAPTVPELPCFIPGGVGIQDGICCQQSHPRPGMNGMPGVD